VGLLPWHRLATTRQIGPLRPVSREGVAKNCENLGIGGRAIPTVYAFGPFRLDEQGDALFRDGEPVALSHRAVALLRILIDRAGVPVSKDGQRGRASRLRKVTSRFRLLRCAGHLARCPVVKAGL